MGEEMQAAHKLADILAETLFYICECPTFALQEMVENARNHRIFIGLVWEEHFEHPHRVFHEWKTCPVLLVLVCFLCRLPHLEEAFGIVRNLRRLHPLHKRIVRLDFQNTH